MSDSYDVLFAPTGSSLLMVGVEVHRWRIGPCFALADGEVGLDQHEVRRCDGWYRHITLALFALAYPVVIQVRATGPVGGRSTLPPLCCL